MPIKNPIDCFKKHGRKDLQDIFDKHPQQGKLSDYEIAREIILGEHEALHKSLNDVRKKLSVKQVPYEKQPAPDIKKINDDYNKRIADEKANAEADNADKQSKLEAEEKIKPVEPVVEDKPPAGKEPPPNKEVVADEEFKNNPKAILNRVFNSKNISEENKKKFENKLTYNPQSHEVARQMAKEIIDEFGVEDSIAMAESGRFDGDVNSMIFAEGIDRTFQAEQAAKTREEKTKFAEKWEDYVLRYDETARQKGKFISAIYDFYKKSPLGVILAERTKRDQAFKDWFGKREKPFKEVFEALREEPEFKELISQQVKNERVANRMKRRQKIESIFDQAKIKSDQLSSAIIPPQIWNAAVEVMKQAALAGESIVSIIQKGVDFINDNQKNAWDVDGFEKEWSEKLSGMDGGKPELTSQEKQKRVLDKFRKRLAGMTEEQKEDVIRKSFKKLVDNGALEFDEFKKIIADVMGLGELSQEEIKMLSGFVQDINAVQDKAEEALKQTDPKSIKDALKQFDDAAKKAEHSATKLAGMLQIKPQVGQRIRSIIQLNTLGVVSLIKNPFYNIFHQMLVRFPKGVFLTVLDQTIYGASLLGNKLFGNPVIKPDVNIFLAQGGYLSKGASGGGQAIKQVFTGLTNKDYFQKEVYQSQTKPWTSMKDLWNWGRGKKNLSAGEITDKIIQATVGIPAEMVARGLNIGDKPFRYAAEGAIAETIAKQEFGLKGIEKERFLRFPMEVAKSIYLKRKYSEEDAIKKAEAIRQRIISEGEEAVFQQSNMISDVIAGIKQKLSTKNEEGTPLNAVAAGGAKLFGVLNMPYVKTPVNIAWEVFNLVNPEVALLQSFLYGVKAAKSGSKADYIKAKKWMAHAAVGWSLLTATAYLASIGAISGDDEDEAYKAKEAKGKGAYTKPKSLNTSKLWRSIFGGSLQDEDDDLLVDLSWFGAPGMISNMQANKNENLSKEEKEQMTYIDDLLNRLHSGATEGLTNSVFQGTLTAVDAFRTGRTDQWMLGMMNVGGNFFEPATIAQLSRATRPYDYQIKGDDFTEKMQNNFKARFFGKVTPKVNIWGDKVERSGNPKDVALRMLGFTKYDKDAIAEPIFQDFKRTGDAGFFPPAVSPSFTVKNTPITLNTEQQVQYETLVGQSRKTLVAPFVNNAAELKGMRYNEMNDEQKKDALSKLYDKGREAGKKMFLILNPDLLQQIPK